MSGSSKLRPFLGGAAFPFAVYAILPHDEPGFLGGDLGAFAYGVGLGGLGVTLLGTYGLVKRSPRALAGAGGLLSGILGLWGYSVVKDKAKKETSTSGTQVTSTYELGLRMQQERNW